MRLTPHQAETVKTLAQRRFGADAALWLFGSRADDRKKALLKGSNPENVRDRTERN